MGAGGFEHPPKPSGKPHVGGPGGVNCGALPGDSGSKTAPAGGDAGGGQARDPGDRQAPAEGGGPGPADPDLTAVARAWADLSPAQRKAVRAMVEASAATPKGIA